MEATNVPSWMDDMKTRLALDAAESDSARRGAQIAAMKIRSRAPELWKALFNELVRMVNGLLLFGVRAGISVPETLGSEERSRINLAWQDAPNPDVQYVEIVYSPSKQFVSFRPSWGRSFDLTFRVLDDSVSLFDDENFAYLEITAGGERVGKAILDRYKSTRAHELYT